MSLRFRGGDYIQRGRGIGGLLRMAKSIFLPFMKTAGKSIIKAGKSKAGKVVLGAIKDQAISSDPEKISTSCKNMLCITYSFVII